MDEPTAGVDPIGIDDIKLLIRKLMENRLLTIRASENTVRILPPLNVKKSEINIAVQIIRKVCKEYK